jgi:C-terminal peptidase prc
LSEQQAENKLISNDDRIDRHSLKWGLFLFFTLIIFITGTSFFIVSDDELYYSLRLPLALKYIKILYPESYDSGKMLKTAREAIMGELDRYSGYLEPREMERVNEEFGGTYGGIGINIVDHDQGLLVTNVRENGPASKAGILIGDVILSANGTILKEITVHEATFVLRGKEGTKVDLTIARHRLTDTLNLSLTREIIPMIHIPYAGLTEENSLYIRIDDFDAGVTDELKSILDTLYVPSKDIIGAIILDVRNNPGGLLIEAIHLADLFLNKDLLIVGTSGRSRWVDSRFYSTGSDITDNTPIAVLTDRGTASSAEIVAGALRYNGRAIMVGDTTFGKGLVQEYGGYFDGSGLRLTRSRYFFEGGIYINHPDSNVSDSSIGIPPDYYVEPLISNPFLAELESSFLMREFAFERSDEIVKFTPFTEAEPEWITEFNEFARENRFNYVSNLTILAVLNRSRIALEGYSEPVFNAIGNICDISKHQDKQQFDLYKEYIKQRIYQIALETEFGLAYAFKNAIIPFRQDIILAENILQKEADDWTR